MTSHRLRLAGAWLLGSFVAVAPRGARANSWEEFAGVSRPMIIGGRDATGIAAEVVVKVHTDTPLRSAACSGVLVARRVVATAKHCIAASATAPHPCDITSDIQDDYGALAEPKYVTVRRSGGAVATGIRIIASTSRSLCRDDIAFVALDNDIPGPRPALRRFRKTHAGDSVTVVGVGRTSDDVLAPEATGPMERAVRVTESADDGATASVAPRTFAVGEGPCRGDSGGGAFSTDTGALVGIFSRFSRACTGPTSHNVFSLVASYGSLLDEALAVTGEALVYEPGASAPGETCEREEECAAGGVCALLAGDATKKCVVACQGLECPTADADTRNVPRPVQDRGLCSMKMPAGGSAPWGVVLFAVACAMARSRRGKRR